VGDERRSNRVTTINETVQQSLSQAGYGQYQRYATPVVTALVNREQEIAGRLLQFAEGSDLDVNAVRSALTDCGMHMPQPQVQAMTTAQSEDTDADPLTATLGRIEQALTAQNTAISNLTEFARRNGYSG